MFTSQLPAFVLSSLLALGACASEEQVLPGEQETPMTPCAEVKQHIDKQCVLNGVFQSSAECDPVIIAELLIEACPDLMRGETDEELCSMGIAANCPQEAPPEPDTFAECSAYVELDGASACDFYLCQEDEIPESDRCGEEGYYIGYGYKYCNRFQETANERLSPEGSAWVGRVMPCLMAVIQDEVVLKDSCETTKQIAFDSHPDCYLESGFCDLTPDDMAWIFLTVDLTDFDFRQVLVTGVNCLQQWGSEPK